MHEFIAHARAHTHTRTNAHTLIYVYQAEFEALPAKDTERFQSVASMNYDSGWKTCVLCFNGHRIDGSLSLSLSLALSRSLFSVNDF